MKTMCSPGYRHNGFVATHTLAHMIYGYTLLVPMNQRVLQFTLLIYLSYFEKVYYQTFFNNARNSSNGRSHFGYTYL